jgi:hypothetical protein
VPPEFVDGAFLARTHPVPDCKSARGPSRRRSASQAIDLPSGGGSVLDGYSHRRTICAIRLSSPTRPSSSSDFARISPIVLRPADIKAFRRIVGKRTVSINASSGKFGAASNLASAILPSPSTPPGRSGRGTSWLPNPFRSNESGISPDLIGPDGGADI